MGIKELIKRLNDIKERRIDEIIKALDELEILRQEKKKDVEANWNKKMDEVYVCICGGQRWVIVGVKIECDKCGKEYELMWDVGIDGQMENPKEFNERIKKEEN